MALLFYYTLLGTLIHISTSLEDEWEKVGCDVYFKPKNCEFHKLSPLTVEDYDRCVPAILNITTRNYYLGAAGRRITYKANKKAYERIRIIPKMMRDVSDSSLAVSTLGQKMSLPIGLAPVAFQTFAHPLGELATVKAIADIGTVMILSTLSSTAIEDVAAEARGSSVHLWMQIYIFKDRTLTVDLIKRAERAGFKGIVVTVDSPMPAPLTCGSRAGIGEQDIVNLGIKVKDIAIDKAQTFKDITWLTRLTELPIIAKGVLSAQDGIDAVRAGAKAIIVSNHGGRQMDGAPATIDVLPGIVDAVRRIEPRIEFYLDGGIRNGWDVYKAIASGAKMVFIGRPIIWGLAKGGDTGVKQVVNILKKEFEEAMIIAGASNPSKISRSTLAKDCDD